MLDTNPDALSIADTLDAERKEKGRGDRSTHPILIKDNIATADQMETTAGSQPWSGQAAARCLCGRAAARGGGDPPWQDQPLRVGELPLHPLLLRLERPWWAVPQPLRARPHPLGLLLGSGAGTAANFAAAALGSETDGSIVSPSAANSLVGIKPTLGLVPAPASSPSPTARTPLAPWPGVWPTPRSFWAP